MEYDFTENEKLAALHIVAECMWASCVDRPVDCIDEGSSLTNVLVLMDAGWSKHEAAGTYGALVKKNVICMDKESTNDCWADYVFSEDVFRWAEKHWDEFEKNGKPTKAQVA